MGYLTTFNEEIGLKNKKAIATINKMIKNEEYPFDVQMTKIKKGILNISCDWKNYENDMEKICLFVALLDKNADGEINCEGEQQEDIWKIKIEDGNVLIQKAEIVYDDETNFNLNMVNNITFKKNLYKVTKNKDLQKELVLNEL